MPLLPSSLVLIIVLLHVSVFPENAAALSVGLGQTAKVKSVRMIATLNWAMGNAI